MFYFKNTIQYNNVRNKAFIIKFEWKSNYLQAVPDNLRSSVYKGRSRELGDNVNTSIKYVSESSTSAEQEQLKDVVMESKVQKTRNKGADRHVGEMKIQDIKMNKPDSLKQKHKITKLIIAYPQEGPMYSSSDLPKLKPESLPDPIFYPKLELKFISVPANDTSILHTLINNTGRGIVGEITKEDDVKKDSKRDDVDYTQLEGALKGFPINPKQRAALRKSWRHACDKQAAKSCNKACKSSISKDLGSKDFIRILKKECKRNCKKLFISDDDSGSKSGSDCKADDDYDYWWPKFTNIH